MTNYGKKRHFPKRFAVGLKETEQECRRKHYTKSHSPPYLLYISYITPVCGGPNNYRSSIRDIEERAT